MEELRVVEPEVQVCSRKDHKLKKAAGKLVATIYGDLCHRCGNLIPFGNLNSV